MPYDDRPLDLDAEHDRIAARYEEATATAEDGDRSDTARQQARQAAARAEQHAAAVEWLRDEYGPGCRVVVGGLTMGEDAQVTDRVDAIAETKTHDSIRGAARNFTVAAGVSEAPFYDDEAMTLDDRADAIADLPRHVGKYLHDRINARESVDPDLGNG